MNIKLFLLVSSVLSFAVGCGSAPTGGAASSDDDLSGVADTSDVGCKVILRTASLDLANPVREADGTAWFALTADVDVAKPFAEAGDKPSLRWIDAEGGVHSTSGSDGRPEAVQGAPPAFQRFRLRLTHDTIDANTDSTRLAGSRVSIIPYVVIGKLRYFDHNRVTGPLDTYALWSGDTAGGLVPPPPNNPEIGAGFAVKDAPGICVNPPQPE